MDSGEHNYISISIISRLSQRKTIADVICHVLDFRNLVVMGKKDCILFSSSAPKFPALYLYPKDS